MQPGLGRSRTSPTTAVSAKSGKCNVMDDLRREGRVGLRPSSPPRRTIDRSIDTDPPAEVAHTGIHCREFSEMFSNDFRGRNRLGGWKAWMKAPVRPGDRQASEQERRREEEREGLRHGVGESRERGPQVPAHTALGREDGALREKEKPAPRCCPSGAFSVPDVGGEGRG